MQTSGWKALNYYKENEDIIYNRYSTAEYYNKINGNYVRDENGNIVIEKVLAFNFRDVRFENLVVKNNNVKFVTFRGEVEIGLFAYVSAVYGKIQHVDRRSTITLCFTCKGVYSNNGMPAFSTARTITPLACATSMAVFWLF